MRTLFIALYNANLFTLTDETKRKRLIEEIMPENSHLAQSVVDALADCLGSLLLSGLEQKNPWFHPLDLENPVVWAAFEKYKNREDGDGNRSEKEYMAPQNRVDLINETIPVEEILVDENHFCPSDLSKKELVNELRLFSSVGVSSSNELVNAFLKLC